jgi:hypothetical protein
MPLILAESTNKVQAYPNRPICLPGHKQILGVQGKRRNARRTPGSFQTEEHEAVIRQLESFKEKFGREAGLDDPLFFDPDYDEPTPLTEQKVKRELIEAARKAGLDVDRVLCGLGFEYEEEGVVEDF